MPLASVSGTLRGARAGHAADQQPGAGAHARPVASAYRSAGNRTDHGTHGGAAYAGVGGGLIRGGTSHLA